MNYLNRKIIIVTLLSLLIFLLFGNVSHSETQGAKIGKEIKEYVVQITPKFKNGEGTGFGFIVGERDDNFFVVTAKHVVIKEEKEKPEEKAELIELTFYKDQGKLYKAKLLNIDKSGIDLALLEVQKPFKKFEWNKKIIDTRSPKENEPVWFIGWNNEIRICPFDDQKIIESPLTNNNIIKVATRDVQKGTSGSPLFTEKGIVGMIITDESTKHNENIHISKALYIETIKNVVLNIWKYPWDLEIEDGTFTIEKLMWTKSKVICDNHDVMTWREATGCVKEASQKRYKGYEDWRLPSKDELIELAKFIKSNRGLFLNTDTSYWSWNNSGFDAFVVNESGRAEKKDKKDNQASVRLVRSIE